MKPSSTITEPSCGSARSIETTRRERRGDDLSERSGRSTRSTRRPESDGSGTASIVRYSNAPLTTTTKSRQFHGLRMYERGPEQKLIEITRTTSSSRKSGVHT